MKKSKILLLAFVLVPLCFVAGLLFQSYRVLPSAKLHEFLIQKIQGLTEGTLKYGEVHVGYFPQPRIIFENPQLTFSDRPVSVEAEKIQFDFNILPLFLGRAEPAAFYVQSGRAALPLPGLDLLGPVRLDNFSLQVGAIRPQVPIPFHFVSDLAGKSHALVVKGNVALDSIDQWDWAKASGYMTVELKQLELASPEIGRTGAGQKVFFKAGQVDSSVEIKKKANDAFLELTATGTGKGLVYEIPQEKSLITPPPLDAEWQVTAAWNQDTAELKIHKGKVKLPFGDIEMNGNMEFNAGEISGMHMTGSEMALEDLLKYWPGLENAIPFHIGFSGPGKWVLSMEGALDHLSLHYNWDLGQVLLSYGQYFSKPKGTPLDLSFDLLLQKSALLNGDFAVKFKEMSMKGNLKDLDLKTGGGQLSLITNKFSMEGWEEYIPALQKYKLGGDVKLLANWKGDLRQLEKAERIFNITFDKASWTVPGGSGVRNASFSMDYSPLMVEGRQMQFEIGDSPVVADLKISGLPDNPLGELKVSSVELKPLEVYQSAKAVFHAGVAGAATEEADPVKDSLKGFFSAGQTLKNVLAEIRYGGGQWEMPVLQFESYSGKADLQSKWSSKDSMTQCHWSGEIRDLDLGLFLGEQDAGKRVFEGVLGLRGTMDGAGWLPRLSDQTLTGQGQWTLKNGKFITIDLKNALLLVEPLEGLRNSVSDLKGFEVMDLQWRIAEGKMATDNLLIRSADYVIDGEGTLDFEGLANFRMDFFLSSAMAAELLPGMAKQFLKNPQAHLGPIPVLLSGPLNSPEIKPDPVPAGELAAKIREEKAKEILVELVLE